MIFFTTCAKMPFGKFCELMRRVLSDLFLFLLMICLGIGFISYFQQFFGPLHEKMPVDLSLSHLPQYTFFSLSRGLFSYALSLLFSVAWGFWAAKDRIAEKVLIPFLDVLQSIPFLGFLPGVVLLLVGLFPHSNIGLELAAIILMFTSQVWNMTFGVYHAIRTVPIEKNECATLYRFNSWERFRWVEMPFAALSLIWNSIMSMAGGWFFLMINEAFTLGSRDFRLPGLGSYMSVAAARGNVPSMINAIVAMIMLIVFLDQLLWRPLVVWSQRLRIEETAPSKQAQSWFFNILKNSYCIEWLKKLFERGNAFVQNRRAAHSVKRDYASVGKRVSRACLFILLVLLTIAAFFVVKLLIHVSFQEWLYLSKMLLFTFCRVCICVALSVVIMVPLGLWIALSEKWFRILEPFIQICASFPATLLFPVLILLFQLWGIPLSMGSIVLMLMGTQWYILFNVMAGTRAMPSDLREAAKSFKFRRMQRFFWLYIPAIFPYLITGVLSASGGAWNASIVAEYAAFKGKVWTTQGLGSSISLAAQNNNFPLLAASVLVMVIVVVIINYQVWLRLYHYSEKRFALNV
jgi:NitT/TauT family transport system permease protein